MAVDDQDERGNRRDAVAAGQRLLAGRRRLCELHNLAFAACARWRHLLAGAAPRRREIEDDAFRDVFAAGDRPAGEHRGERHDDGKGIEQKAAIFDSRNFSDTLSATQGWDIESASMPM